MAKKILIVEDEPTLTVLLSYTLQQHGYQIASASNGKEGLNLALEGDSDLILLDLVHPGMSEIEWIGKLRQMGGHTPVVILSSNKTNKNIADGLMAGADDYIVKPFEVSILLARISTVIRRSGMTDPLGILKAERVVEVGDIKIYSDKYEAIANDSVIPLRRKELDILLYLSNRPGTVVPRDEIIENVWGADYFGGGRALDVHISLLRKKIHTASKCVTIASTRSVGYKLTLKDQSKVSAFKTIIGIFVAELISTITQGMEMGFIL